MSKRTIDLSQLSTNQLLAFRSALVGQVATAETPKAKRLREAEAELAELKRKEEYRGICASYDLDFDDDPDYFLSFNKYHLHTTCKHLSDAKKDVALAERTHTIKIPPVFRAEDVSGIELIRQGFKERKNGHKTI